MNEVARAHLSALIERIVPARDGLFRLLGPVAPLEYAALRLLVGADLPVETASVPNAERFVLDETLLFARPVDEGCLCIDFGTAASKVGFEPGGDRFEPLEIGEEGRDPFWVRSAIAIGLDGIVVFGQAALDSARLADVPVLTSFKSKLWGDPAVLASPALAHGGVTFSFADAIQAYLACLTRLAARRLEERGVNPYVRRRHAMPFAYDDARKHVRVLLGVMVGRAVLLADTLGDQLIEGVPAARMRAALDAAADRYAPDWLLAEPACVGEPVAAGAFALDAEAAPLTVYMIADVGAGTTDFCILCLKKRADGEMEPIQIRNGALSVELAGDAVDTALVDFLSEQVGDEHRRRLAADAPAIKERLFGRGVGDDEVFYHDLPDRNLVEVSRRDFLASPYWQALIEQLRAAQARCFDQADRKYLQDFGPGGAIRVVMTGGGAALPLAGALASGVSPGAVKVNRIAAAGLPLAIRQRFATIEADLPRLAVALGGARDLLPADYDRTAARTSTGITAPYVWRPIDKSRTGLDAA